METFVVSHNQLSTNDFGHDLNKVVTVITHMELDDCEGLPRDFRDEHTLCPEHKPLLSSQPFPWPHPCNNSISKTQGSYSYQLSYLHLLERWAPLAWPSRGIPRHSFYCWLTLKDRLPTHDRLLRWGLQIQPLCLLCNAFPESRDYLYWECDMTFQLWSRASSRCGLTPLHSWGPAIDQLLSLPPPRSTRILILLAWQATLYLIWNERNARLHSNTFRSLGKPVRKKNDLGGGLGDLLITQTLNGQYQPLAPLRNPLNQYLHVADHNSSYTPQLQQDNHICQEHLKHPSNALPLD
ncbi:hypothetical protein YC2023_052713 [Brassica napus]